MNNPRRIKKRKKRIILFIVEGFLLLIIAVFLFVNSMLDKINIEEIDPEEISSNAVDEEAAAIMEGYTNIALFGVDARDNATLDKGTRSDAIVICSINNTTKEIRLVSVYRDSYFALKGDNQFDKICHAYAFGGASQAISALNTNMDLILTEYVTVNWKAVADAINILGGIDVEITKSEFTQINGFITETVKSTGIGSVHLKSAGMNHLDGVQAVAYARLRKMDTDYRRTERQRLVIELTMQKAKSADIGTLINLVNTVLPNVYTSLDKGQIMDLTKNITKYSIVETTGFPFDKESKMMGVKGDCVIPLGLEQNVYQLHSFLFGNESYAASNMVTKIDKMIKDATGWGNPGTTVKANASNNSNLAATEDASQEDTTVEGNSIIEDSATELSTEDLETTASLESGQSTEGVTTEESLSVSPVEATIENSLTVTAEYIPE